MDLANMGHGTGSACNMSGMQHGNGQQMNEQMGNDPQMEACAQECRRCAESCRDMASVR